MEIQFKKNYSPLSLEYLCKINYNTETYQSADIAVKACGKDKTEEICEAKFRQHPSLMDLLLFTGNADINDETDTNTVGKILMRLRTKFKEERMK